jgi:hypothetical protein
MILTPTETEVSTENEMEEYNRISGRNFTDSESQTSQDEEPTTIILTDEDVAYCNTQMDRLKPMYFAYIQDNILNTQFNTEIINLFRQIDVGVLMAYLYFKTTGINRYELYNYVRGLTVDNLIKQYLYFGVVPAFLSDSERAAQGFSREYFLWTKSDNDVERPDLRLAITAENFSSYRQNNIDGWDYFQLATFVRVNIIPEYFKLIEINMNQKHTFYLEYFQFDKIRLRNVILAYLHNKQSLFEPSLMNTIKNMSCTDNSAIFHFYGVINNLPNVPRYAQIASTLLFSLAIDLKCAQYRNVQRLLKKLKDSVIRPRKETQRFKWQNLCSPSKLGSFHFDDLRELAALERIPQHMFLTKRELCAELATRFENVIAGKEKIQSKCINTTSIMLTDIEDIPPEFFYSYSHNNKLYCDDIRDLYKHFQTSGASHPIDRTPVKQRLVSQVNEWYTYLTTTTNTLEDLFTAPQAVLSQSSLLSSKAADFASKLNYPNSLETFINADNTMLSLFTEELIAENLLSRQEKSTLSVLQDVTQYKMTLMEMLLLKIRNDPQQITLPNGSRLSTVAINLSNVYNNHF